LPSPLRIAFMGTPAFAVPSLEALVDAGYPPVVVVTAPDRPAGRGLALQASAVREAAQRHGLPLLQPESVRDPEFVEMLDALEPDVMAVVAFRILPVEVYSLARRGAFNLHASLLPAFRGAAPIQRALMAGASETGVTTFFLRPTVDTGDVILRRRVPVGPDETGGELHDRLATLGAEAVVDTVRRIEAGDVETTPQDDSLASPAPKIFRDDARIDWHLPARGVHDHVRAMSPHPAAWTTSPGDVVLKVLRTRVESETGAAGKPGTVLRADDRLVVAAAAGAVEILEVQREGRARMPAVDFLRGASLSTGEALGRG
jgi:methionyl-tRNA formyltransferase